MTPHLSIGLQVMEFNGLVRFVDMQTFILVYQLMLKLQQISYIN